MFPIKKIKWLLLSLSLAPITALHALTIRYSDQGDAKIAALDIYVFNEPKDFKNMLNTLGFANDAIDAIVTTANAIPLDEINALFPGTKSAPKKESKEPQQEPQKEEKKSDIKVGEHRLPEQGPAEKPASTPETPWLPSKPITKSNVQSDIDLSGMTGDKSKEEKAKDAAQSAENTKKEIAEEKKKEEKKEVEAKAEGKSAVELSDASDKVKAAASKAQTVIKVAKWGLDTAVSFTKVFQKYFLNDIIKNKYTVANFKYVGKGGLGKISWTKTHWAKDAKPGVYVVAFEAMLDGKMPSQPVFQGYVESNYDLTLKIDRDPDQEGFITTVSKKRLEEDAGHVFENQTSEPYTVTLSTDGKCPNYHFSIDGNSKYEIARKEDCKIKKVVLYPYGATRLAHNRVAPLYPSRNPTNEVEFKKPTSELLYISVRDNDKNNPGIPYVRVYHKRDMTQSVRTVVRDSREDKSAGIAETVSAADVPKLNPNRPAPQKK